MLAADRLDTARFITHRSPLDQFNDAHQAFSRSNDTGALKVVLTRL